jgi:hypothetical protein
MKTHLYYSPKELACFIQNRAKHVYSCGNNGGPGSCESNSLHPLFHLFGPAPSSCIGLHKYCLMVRKRCSRDGCNKHIVNGGVCITHGAVVKRCSHERCTNGAVKGGVCVTHGAVVKRCNFERCTKQAQKGGVCKKHGAKIKRCSHHEGCTKGAHTGGVCITHGAKLVNNSNDEGGESGINISNNNDNTKTKQQPSSRPKSHISFYVELLYMHYHPRKNSDYIHCTCKNHKCGGSFRLFRWLFNSKHDGNTLDTI